MLVGTELWDRLPAVPFVPGLDGDTFAFTGTQSRTVPAWALRTSLTPDVVLIEGLKGDTPPSAGDPGVVFTLLDVTMSSEGRLAAASAAKTEKYEALCKALSNVGWRVRPFVPLAFGVRGGVPRATLDSLEALGVNSGPARAALVRVHMVACDYLRRICHFKRVAETAVLGDFRARRARVAALRAGRPPGRPPG